MARKEYGHFNCRNKAGHKDGKTHINQRLYSREDVDKYLAHRVNGKVVKGEPFPPCPECGAHQSLTDHQLQAEFDKVFRL